MVSLQAAGNTSNIASLDGITPNAAGQVTITIGHGASATYGYLGVMTITTPGAAPPAPPQLGASVVAHQMVFTWSPITTDYLLQSATNLAAGASWITVTNTANLNGQYAIPMPGTGPRMFFRLSSK